MWEPEPQGDLMMVGRMGSAILDKLTGVRTQGAEHGVGVSPRACGSRLPSAALGSWMRCRDTRRASPRASGPPLGTPLHMCRSNNTAQGGGLACYSWHGLCCPPAVATKTLIHRVLPSGTLPETQSDAETSLRSAEITGPQLRNTLTLPFEAGTRAAKL